MHFPSLSLLLRTYKADIIKIVVAMLVVGVGTALILAFAVTRSYTSEIQILVIQKYTLTDSYTAAKSAEKISENLAEVIKTSVFFNDIASAGTVDLGDIKALSEEDRRKEWSKKLSSDTSSAASILKITAFDPNRERAEAIANTVANVLIEKGSEYHGAPDTISLKVVDTALTSEKPTSPSIPLYSIAASLFVGLAFLLYVILAKGGMWLDSDTERVSTTPTPKKNKGQYVQPVAPIAPVTVPTMSQPDASVLLQPQSVVADQSAMASSVGDLNMRNFNSKLGAQNPDEKAKYLHGTVQTMHDHQS